MNPAPFDHRGLPEGYAFRPELELTPRQAHEAKGLTIIDCRTENEWETAHIPGSTHMPLDRLLILADDLETDQNIAVICHHGHRSLRAALLLREMGFANVRSIAGGIDLWSQTVDASIPRYDRRNGVCTIVPTP